MLLLGDGRVSRSSEPISNNSLVRHVPDATSAACPLLLGSVASEAGVKTYIGLERYALTFSIEREHLTAKPRDGF